MRGSRFMVTRFRTVHTALAIFNCLSKLVITASEAGAMNTGFAIVPYPSLAGLLHFAHRFLASDALFLPRCRGDPSLLSGAPCCIRRGTRFDASLQLQQDG